MRAFLLAVVMMGSAVAFQMAPAQRAPTTALSAVDEMQIGVQAPAGFYDPLGACLFKEEPPTL